MPFFLASTHRSGKTFRTGRSRGEGLLGNLEKRDGLTAIARFLTMGYTSA
jgi:hypothetical protein